MAKANISYAQAAIEIAKIVAGKEQLTIDNLYHHFDGKVSKKIIKKYISEWEARHQRPDASDIKISSKNFDTKTQNRNNNSSLIKRTEELEHLISLVRATLESTADGILIINNTGKMVDWNKKFIDLLNVPEHVFHNRDEGEGLSKLMGIVDSPEELFGLMEKAYKNPEMSGDCGEMKFKDGRIISRYSQPHKVDGKIIGRVWSFRDVTEKRKAEEELRLRDRAINSANDGICLIDILDKNNPIIYANPAFTQITGYKIKDIVGKNLDSVFKHAASQPDYHKIHLALKEHRDDIAVLKNKKSNNEAYWCELHIAPVKDKHEQITHFVAIINDVTQRKKMEEQLSYQATHDMLTDLPNRPLLVDRVQQAILHSNSKVKPFALLFIDLDHFKLINDSLGHTIGDELLQHVAQRLSKNIRPLDTLARIGGDEFILLLNSFEHEEEVMLITKRILASLSEPYKVKKHILNVTASVGVSFYPKDGKNVESLLKNADVSMYNAKDLGRNTFCLYNKEQHKKFLHRLKLETHLRDALKNEEFSLLYQPLIDLQENKFFGVEALIRWHSPKLGHIPPLDFITIAEETGLIIDIGEWVIHTATHQVKAWQEMGLDHIKMSINLSAKQFSQANLSERITQAINAAHISSDNIELELTESMLINNIDKNIKQLAKLKDMGVTLSIDDFGTGYSSLNYLNKFPVDKLKIDRSFIKDIHDQNSESPITLAVIQLGHTLGLKVLAEGIETNEQKQFLIRHGCDQAQGYFFSKPIDKDACTRLLQDNQS
jgi:diguanylate cyclase (GGDEF)-like protein/PAS domain S-box-containing protein